MSAVVSTATVTAWETRPSFQSVGLVCTCGKAVATYEGYARACDGCGAVYLVNVMVLKAGEPHRAVNATLPPAFTDGPVADTAEPVAAEAGRPIPEPDGNHLDAMGHE